MESNSPGRETDDQKAHRLQREAESEILVECSNRVTGITRIIESYVNGADSNPYKWKGEVTAEYVNQFGGIDRTNIPFAFSTDSDSEGIAYVYCHYDWQKALGISDRKLKVPIESAFGLKLGDSLSSDCQVISEEMNDHDGYIMVKLVPPQPNQSFIDYRVELNPTNRLISFISADGAGITDDSSLDKIGPLVEALRQHYGSENSTREGNDNREYNWQQDGRYLELSFVGETPFFSCWDSFLYQPIKPTVDTHGL